MQLVTHLKFYIGPVKLYFSENTLLQSWKVRLLFLVAAILNIMLFLIHPNILAKFGIAYYSYKLCYRSSTLVCFSENQPVSLLCLFLPKVSFMCNSHKTYWTITFHIKKGEEIDKEVLHDELYDKYFKFNLSSTSEKIIKRLPSHEIQGTCS